MPVNAWPAAILWESWAWTSISQHWDGGAKEWGWLEVVLGGLMVQGQPSTAPLKTLPETTVPAWRLVGFHRPLDTAFMEIFVTFLLTIQILFSSILPTHSKELHLSCLLLAVWESPSPF